MSAKTLPPTTAAICPEQFPEVLPFITNKRLTACILFFVLLAGFGLRVMELGSESLSEDELNKLQTVEEYRQNGLSGRNGEHPFLMKGLQTASIVAAEGINRAAPSLHISEEAALRFPIALFGTFISLLLFFFASELFGKSIGLVTAALRAVEPMAVGFDRIAKEDTLVLFFFLLCSLFFVKGQTAAERGEENWLRYMWAAAASFGGLMASKYYPHLLGVMGGYYNAFLKLPNKKWGLGKPAWLKFFVVMGVAFVLLNPTILLPDTWREMLKFSSENRIGHDSYEYLGALYPNKMSAWLAGVPWTFYYLFIAVKTPLTTLVLFLIGLPLIFLRRYGDGRLFLAVWAFMWFLPFTFLGGKFTRYFTLPEPIILIVAAVGLCAVIGWLGKRLSSPMSAVVQSAVLLAVIAVPAYDSFEAAPHYRLFTNVLGGGTAKAGTYFPHDEFYDTSTRDIVSVIAEQAGPNVKVACETPGLYEYYANKAGRPDLVFISLSDPKAAATIEAGDIVVDAYGRKYRSNADYLKRLNDLLPSRTEVRAGGIPSALVFVLDGPAANAVRMKAAEAVSRN